MENNKRLKGVYERMRESPILIFELPKKNKTEQKYIAGIDPITSDKSSIGYHLSPSEEILLNEVRREDMADDLLKHAKEEFRGYNDDKFLLDEVGQWDKRLFSDPFVCVGWEFINLSENE